MKRVELNRFDIVPRKARANGGYEEITYGKDREVWLGVERIYSNNSKVVPKIGGISISIDWLQPVARAERFSHFYTLPFEERLSLIRRGKHPFGEGVRAEATVKFDGGQPEYPPHSGIDVIKHLLNEIYIVANLSVPAASTCIDRIFSLLA